MTYAEEEFYKNEYLLGRKPVIGAGFAFYARFSSQIIDEYTFGRMKCLGVVPEEVKMCCCELAELEYQKEKQKKASGGKASEKVGTYSVSFVSVQEQASEIAQEQRSIVMKWLSETGLCYQGVN